jgi:pilus assembly protein CpaD
MAIANKTSAGAITLVLAAALAGCGGMPENRSLNSMNQPVVERTSYTLDLAAGAGGLPVAEQQRLDGWFDAMDLSYGDRLSIDDPMMSTATRENIAELAARRGVLLSEGAPVTAGTIEPGRARVVLTRSTASVPGCPDWSAKSDVNLANGLYPNFGCAVNSNLAAMVANPEDLITGQTGTGETVVTSAVKAIDAYRAAPPTSLTGLTETETSEGGD